MKTVRRLWLIVGVLAALSPLGLIIPEVARSGAAWGEWGKDELREKAGFMPEGTNASGQWAGIFPEYSFGSKRNRHLGYLVSAVTGAAAVAACAVLLLRKRD